MLGWRLNALFHEVGEYFPKRSVKQTKCYIFNSTLENRHRQFYLVIYISLNSKLAGEHGSFSHAHYM